MLVVRTRQTAPAQEAAPLCNNVQNVGAWVRAVLNPGDNLRHTTASLLMMAGVNPGAVQRILRHSDPRITSETYGHLQPDYLILPRFGGHHSEGVDGVHGGAEEAAYSPQVH